MKGVFQVTIADSKGNVQPFASVSFRDQATDELVTLYSDTTGTVSPGNPKTADEFGALTVYLDPDVAHKITATKGSFSRTWNNYYPVPGVVDSSDAGLMSASDKSKLDAISSGADVTEDAILSAPSKSTPEDDDAMALIDFGDTSLSLKKFTLADLKTVLFPSGTYTATATGLTTTPTLTVYYRVAGNIVYLSTNEQISGSSNTATFSLTGAPAAIRPATSNGKTAVRIIDNNNFTNGYVQMSTGGTLTFSVSGNGGSNGFNSGGNSKGVDEFFISYMLSLPS